MIASTLPLLFLDVDGPLIPFGATPQQLPDGYPTYDSPGRPHGAEPHPLITRLNPALGARLLALPCTLVWATTWMSDANDIVAPWLGLPELPVVDWPDTDTDTDTDTDASDGLHWKTRPLLDWAAGRPFVWIDDEITERDQDWIEAHHPEQALLHRVDPTHGLTGQDIATLDRWLQLHQG